MNNINAKPAAWQTVDTRVSTASTPGMETMQAQFEGELVKLVADIPFFDNGSYTQKLQLLLPDADSDALRPLILFIRGSAWRKQQTLAGMPQLVELAKRGYVIASAEYRPCDEATFPTQIEDAQRALQFLSERADEMAVDKNKIAVWGTSSGAHTSMMMALMPHKVELPKIRAVVDFYGPALLQPREDALQENLTLLIGGPLEENTQRLLEASPVSYITEQADIPPFFMLYGDRDPAVPLEQGVLLYEKLMACKQDARLIKLEGAGHGGTPFWNTTVMDLVDAFLREKLG